MKKFLAMTAAALLATTTLASAATLSFTSGAEFNRLQVTGPANVVYTVLTAEFINDASENFVTVLGTPLTPGSTTLYSSNPIVGQSTSRIINQGAAASTILRFLMGSAFTGFSANNFTGDLGGPSLISFSSIFNGGKSVIAYFEMGDDAGYDEMSIQIDVAEVPVPAAGLLLLSGLGGLGLMRRRKKA